MFVRADDRRAQGKDGAGLEACGADGRARSSFGIVSRGGTQPPGRLSARRAVFRLRRWRSAQRARLGRRQAGRAAVSARGPRLCGDAAVTMVIVRGGNAEHGDGSAAGAADVPAHILTGPRRRSAGRACTGHRLGRGPTTSLRRFEKERSQRNEPPAGRSGGRLPRRPGMGRCILAGRNSWQFRMPTGSCRSGQRRSRRMKEIAGAGETLR